MKLEQLNLLSVHEKVVITNTYDYPNNRMIVAAFPSPPQPTNQPTKTCTSFTARHTNKQKV
jgi:hypothetical protein